jgi:trimeric autotransporter adhesin
MHFPQVDSFLPFVRHFVTKWVAGVIAAALLVLCVSVVHAAPPPAGVAISNQASATYSDASGVQRSINSNIVQTIVQQVASMTLTSNGAQNATAGSVVYYPHTLTNTGNGSDTYTLNTSNSGIFSMAGVQIFLDNGSGQPTGPAISGTGPLAANAQFRFIVAATLPSTAVATNTLVITGNSVFDATKSGSNNDVTTVTANAVLTLTKAVSVSSGAPGAAPFRYSLTYTNTGNSNATAVTISDAIPAGLDYVVGSARWSVTGVTALSDTGGSTGSSPNTVTSSYAAAGNVFTAVLAQVGPGQSGILSFDVKVAAGAAPRIANNTANSSYNNGAAIVTGSSNTVPFVILQVGKLTMLGATVAGPAAPGSTSVFTNVLTNSGTGTDTFDIVLNANNFPAGTTFQVFKTDGVTPMVDTNGNGKVDTGPIPQGASYNVVVKATLPPNASNAGAPFSIDKTATSAVDPTKFVTVTDTLQAISAASVDLRNTSATGPGAGAGPETGSVLTNITGPNSVSTFVLNVSNTGLSPDSYNLGASTVSNFGAVALPPGWTVSFRADGGLGNCSTTGATISNTGSLAAGASVAVCAIVAIPVGAPAATSDLYFRALSPTSAAIDILHDAVTVSPLRALAFTNAGTGQTFPGGSFVHSHSLTNNGNVVEGNGSASSISIASANNQPGWTSALYYDANNNGILDATDPLIIGSLNSVAGLAAGLAPGQTITIFDKVIAPSGATAGALNATTLTVNTANASYATTAPASLAVTDSTTVIAGNLSLAKTQAVDTACAGPTGSTVYTQATVGAKPGECILYQITATNLGSADATNVVLSDATPNFTTLSNAATTTFGTVATMPAIGGSGSISANVGTLIPAQAAVLTFGVRITP